MNLTLLPSLAVATVLTSTFVYIWRVSKEPYLLVWTLASGIWMVRYAYGLLQPIVVPTDPSWVVPLSSLVRTGLIVLGGAMMVDRPFPYVWWVGAATATAWFAIALPGVPAEVLTLPLYVFFAASLLTAAWWLGHASRFPRFERTLAALPLAIYGALQVIYPWSGTDLLWMAPATHLVASVAQLALVLGLLTVYLRTSELELEANHLRLSQTLNRALNGYLTMCPSCHAIESEAGDWVRLESYVTRRVGTSFSHGVCPPCLDEHYGAIAEG